MCSTLSKLSRDVPFLCCCGVPQFRIRLQTSCARLEMSGDQKYLHGTQLFERFGGARRRLVSFSIGAPKGLGRQPLERPSIRDLGSRLFQITKEVLDQGAVPVDIRGVINTRRQLVELHGGIILSIIGCARSISVVTFWRAARSSG